MESAPPAGSEIKVIARTFAKFPFQSSLDVHINSGIEHERVKLILDELVTVGVLLIVELEGGKRAYQSIDAAVKDSTLFDSIREFLAPLRAITEEEKSKAKEEAKRLEQAILILKIQLQSHPMTKTPLAEEQPKLPRQAVNAAKHRLESEILRIDHDINKYVSVSKLLLDDLADIHGVNGLAILQKLGASRTLQEMLY